MELHNFALNMALAICSGFLMGMERELKGKSAGLKTNTLVALGSCIFLMISLPYKDMTGVDITRVIGQLVIGVGFLGAGVIIQRKHYVSGLATAATIWCSACAGCLAALELYVELLSFTGSVIVINMAFGYLNKKLGKEDPEKQPKEDKD